MLHHTENWPYVVTLSKGASTMEETREFLMPGTAGLMKESPLSRSAGFWTRMLSRIRKDRRVKSSNGFSAMHSAFANRCWGW